MTPWINLLVTTVRLLDLHDSNHERLSPNVRVSQEQRPGLKDGYWLDLASLLLDFLLEEDFITNGAFVSQSRCRNFIREYYPNLSADDLTFVINTLSTPSELFYINRQNAEKGLPRLASTKRTSLVERQPQTGHVRLTAAGRQAVNLAGQVEDLLYSEYDAAKALTAITRGDYGRVPDICNSILLAIRGLTQDIRRIRENPTRESKLQAFQENQRHYHNALNSIQRTILECRQLLTRPEQQKAFELWRNHKQNQQEWELLMLTQSLNRVLNAIENLSRRLTELLTDIADGRIRSMGVIDFSQLALDIAVKPPVAALTQAVVERCMPFAVEACFPSVNDFTQLLQDQRSERSEEALVFDGRDDDARQDTALHRYLSHHGPALRQRLAAEPLSLGSAIEEGWSRIGEDDYLPQLLNMFVDPGQLQEDLVIALDPAQTLDLTLPDGRRLQGDNPTLMLRISAATMPLSDPPATDTATIDTATIDTTTTDNQAATTDVEHTASDAVSEIFQAPQTQTESGI